MSVPTRGRGKKICSLRRLSLRNSFAVRSVCLCQRKSWTREATLMYYLAIIFLFGVAYVHCLRFLPGQLTPIKKNTHTHTKKKLKLVEKAGSASRLNSGLLKRGEIGGGNQKKWAFGQSENNWLVQWLGEPLKEIILQNDVSNGICVNFYSRTTLRETFMSKNVGFPSYQNRQFTFPSETTSISVILIWESHPTSQANSPKHGGFEIAL